MSDRSSDNALVKRVQKGDKGAFDMLVLKYQHKIVNLVMRYVRDPEQALDITQEAFIKAYRALPRFRGDSAFYTWIYRIAINTAKNYLVAQSRRPPGNDVAAEEAEQEVRELLKEELAEEQLRDFYQELKVITRSSDGFDERSVIPVRFVPMTGEIERQGGQ